MSSFIQDVLSQYGYAGVFVFVALECMGIPLPGETMLVSAALYAGATHNLGIGGIVASAAAAAIIGDNLGFAAGHYGGYRLLLRYGPRLHLHPPRVKLARWLFRRYGARVVFFGRFVSVLRAYAAFLAGTARMPWGRFIVFNALGGVVWATVYGVGAYELGSRVTGLRRPAEIAIGAVAVVVIAGAVVLLRRKEAELTQRAEAEMPGPLDQL